MLCFMVRFPRNKVSRTATMNRPHMPWDTGPNCPNPKGIAPQSPGLRGTSYPGYGWKKINYPEGVAPSVRPDPRVPFDRRRAFEVHGEVVVSPNNLGRRYRQAPRSPLYSRSPQSEPISADKFGKGMSNLSEVSFDSVTKGRELQPLGPAGAWRIPNAATVVGILSILVAAG